MQRDRSTGTIDIVLSALSAPVFTIGGTTDINFLVNAATAITVDVYGGTASFSGGLVAGALSGSTINIGYGGTYNGNTQLVSLLQGTTVNFTTGGGTLVLNGGGVFLNLSGTTIAGYDPSKDTIDLKTAILGGPITVPTPSGAVRMNVPADSDTGTVLRLKGRGVKEHGKHEAGNLYVRLEVHIGKADEKLKAFLKGQGAEEEAAPSAG